MITNEPTGQIAAPRFLPVLRVVSRWAAACCLALCLLAPRTARAVPEVPGAPQTQPIALVGGTVHPVSGPNIEGGTVVFVDGRIAAIGADVAIPDGALRVDVSGKHVYPGLIDADTGLGLIEIPSIRATRDGAEVGEINPNVRAQVAVNPDSELLPVARANGVLAVLSVPTGGLLTGTSALIRLDGWTWEEMTVRAPVGMHITWPRFVQPTYRRSFFTAPPAEDAQEALAKIQQAFDDARAYGQQKRAQAVGPRAASPAYDARWEAMLPVLEGAVPAIVRADEWQQIESAVAFAAREKIKLIILGGYDAPRCADLLKQTETPVIVGGVHRLPQRPGDAYDAPFTVPSRLHQAGVKFCVSSSAEAQAVRNLPYHAATAAAYGLPVDAALRAITTDAATILGVGDRLGALEPGKEATLMVATGDPLETTTQIELAYIQGRVVDLNNRHKRLWEKYKEKYRRLGIEN